MKLIDALNIWLDVSGSQLSGGSTGNITFSDMETRRLSEAIREALELDETEETGRLFFEYVVKEYFKGRTFTVESMLSDPDSVKGYLEKSAKLMGYLASDDVKAASESFCGKIIDALKQYEITNPSVYEFVSERIGPAILRRDALRSMNNLRINQFLSGDFCSPDIKPVYGKHIYRWWNINSMLSAMVNMPNGITVNAICNPADPTLNYFCFAIRNGGNLFVFTDKNKSEHPLQDSMRRRPDRDIGDRAYRNWFPYDKLGLKYNEETNKFYIDASDSMAIAPYQQETDLLMPLSDLKECELVWVTMMLDLIVSKFWKGEYQAPQLSYTGEMVKVESKMLTNAKQANLPVKHYTPISAEPLKVSDLYDENVTEEQVGKKYGKNNHWLEMRYRHLVDDSVLNIIAPANKALGMEKDKDSDQYSAIKEIPKKDSFRRFSSRESFIELKHFDSTSFGTQEELENDRVFIARANMAKMIGLEAEKEYEARKNEVRKWVESRIQANIKKAMLDTSEDKVNYTIYNAYSEFRNNSPFDHGRWDPITIQDGKWEDKKGKYPNCFVNGSKSSLFGVIRPTNSHDLAKLCGCEINDLPDVLQHWTEYGMHDGNHLLNRIDPMNWMLKNPWCNLNLRVIIYLSKSGYKELFNKPYEDNQLR